MHKFNCRLNTLSPTTAYIFHFEWDSFQECIHISVFLIWVVCACSHIRDKVYNDGYWSSCQDTGQQYSQGTLRNMKCFLFTLNDPRLQCLSRSCISVLSFSSLQLLILSTVLYPCFTVPLPQFYCTSSNLPYGNKISPLRVGIKNICSPAGVAQ